MTKAEVVAPFDYALLEEGRPTPGREFEWSTGLFHCCGAGFKGLCLFGTFCQPCLFGLVRAKIGGKDTYGEATKWCFAYCTVQVLPAILFNHILPGAGSILASLGITALGGMLRRMVREEYGLREGRCNDYCLSFFCGTCALCQQARELELRRAMAATLPEGSLPIDAPYAQGMQMQR